MEIDDEGDEEVVDYEEEAVKYYKNLHDGPEQIAPPAMMECYSKKSDCIADLLEKVTMELAGFAKPLSLSDLITHKKIRMERRFMHRREIFALTMDELLAEDYKVPDSLVDIYRQIAVIALNYGWLSSVPSMVPAKVIYKIEVEAFKLLIAIGQIQGSIPEGFKKGWHKKSVIEGKQLQKKQTVDKIFKAYEDVGAVWCNSQPEKRPILLKGGRIARSKLSERLFIHLNGEFTQRHIDNCLKELHEKGEI